MDYQLSFGEFTTLSVWLHALMEALGGTRFVLQFADESTYSSATFSALLNFSSTSIETQFDPPSLHNLESFLLTYESRLEKNKHKTLSDALSVNVASDSSPRPSNQVTSQSRPPSMIPLSFYSPRSNFQYLVSPFTGFGHSGSYRGGNRGRRGQYGGRHRGGRSFSRHTSSFCTYYNCQGHGVTVCYYAPSQLGGELTYVGPPGQLGYSNLTTCLPSQFVPHHFNSLNSTFGPASYPSHFYPQYPLDFYTS
ncbi:hypothetical protein Lal_00031834 [Lupinus albus]|nr:hypothetical protein Lal_00031834 [Lupinus albus]